jgi:hypothetical protein
MGIIQHPAARPPAPAVMAILDRFNRDELGHAIEVLIALLDIWDGDPDAQDTGDAEDEMLSGQARRYADKGPGCIVSDSPGDQAWIEWTAMRGKRGQMILGGPEDAEDDDPDTGVEDGAFDPEEDRCLAGDDGCGAFVMHGTTRWGAGEDEGYVAARYGVDQSKGPLPPG